MKDTSYPLFLPEEAHQHLVMTSTVETRLVSDYLLSLVVVFILIVAAYNSKY